MIISLDNHLKFLFSFFNTSAKKCRGVLIMFAQPCIGRCIIWIKLNEKIVMIFSSLKRFKGGEKSGFYLPCLFLQEMTAE